MYKRFSSSLPTQKRGEQHARFLEHRVQEDERSMNERQSLYVVGYCFDCEKGLYKNFCMPKRDCELLTHEVGLLRSIPPHPL